jgi:hypothetical protein
VRRLVLGAIALVVSLWATVYWVEAEKEIVVLCGLSHVGAPLAEVQRLHGTASLAKLRVDSVGTRITTRFASPRNLSLTTCTVTVDDGVATGADYHERFRLAPLTGLRRSLRVEDRVPAAALAMLAPESVVGELLVGAVLLLCTGALVAVLGRAHQRWRWPTAAMLLLAVNSGIVLLIGG